MKTTKQQPTPQWHPYWPDSDGQRCSTCGHHRWYWLHTGPAHGTPVLTERTGKRWKVAQLIGVAILCVSMVVLERAPTAGWWVVGLGALVWLGARTGAWWHHG